MKATKTHQRRASWGSGARPSSPAPTRSLADIRPAEEARIDTILFEMLRDLCYGLGLHEGDTIKCRRSTETTVVLEAADGHAVVLDQDWARFVTIATKS